jgi:hypothetical protein
MLETQVSQKQLKIDTFEKEQQDIFLISKYNEREQQIREFCASFEVLNSQPDSRIEQTQYSGTEMHLDTLKSLHEIILSYASGVPEKMYFNAEQTMERLFAYILKQSSELQRATALRILKRYAKQTNPTDAFT